MITEATLDPVSSVVNVQVTNNYVYVVSVDDHTTGVFDSRLAVIETFPNLVFEELSSGFWKSGNGHNSIYVERFPVQVYVG